MLIKAFIVPWFRLLVFYKTTNLHWKLNKRVAKDFHNKVAVFIWFNCINNSIKLELIEDFPTIIKQETTNKQKIQHRNQSFCFSSWWLGVFPFRCVITVCKWLFSWRKRLADWKLNNRYCLQDLYIRML